jgi:LysM repeat protein
MPDRKPNQIARLIAVLALGTALVLVIVMIASSGFGGEDGEEDGKGTRTSAETERALERGVYVVRPGDTLVSISEQTGISVDELVELNPDIDPQALISGQRIRLD